VLETLLVSDHNDDDTGTRWIIPDFLGLGSFDLFLPYYPVAALPSGNHYYVATSKSWWNIQKHEVRAPWPLDWLVLFTYFTTTKIKTPPTIPPPVASFDWRPVQPVVGEQVVFTSTSYPRDPRSVILETGYHWWLGEGSEKTDKNFTFVYNSPGDYNVTLKVTDNNTLTSNVTKTITVQPAPLARLRVVPDHLELSVQSGQHTTALFAVLESLNETSLHDTAFQADDLQSLAGETIPSSNISFDKNGITVPKGSYENVTVDVCAPPALQYGWYSGNMTATSENGGNATILLDVRIFGPPIANFTWSPLKPWVGGPVTFNAESSSSNGSSIIMYSWDFGDYNTTSISDPILKHTYGVIGAYNVTLTVTNSDDLNDTISEIVNVLQHDVAVVDVVPYRNWIYEGRLVPVNVTLLNCGDFNETVTVDLYYNFTANQQIGTMIVDLSPNETKTLMFVWNTFGVQHCHNYTITALANIQFDSNTTNNVKEGTIRIKVRIRGDINGDGKVDMKDIALAALAFGSDPSYSRWNPDADIDENSKIDLKDIALIAKNFGECA
jgi:PKD repeat protein